MIMEITRIHEKVLDSADNEDGLGVLLMPVSVKPRNGAAFDVHQTSTVDATSAALGELLREGLVELWRTGDRDVDPERVPQNDAEAIAADPHPGLRLGAGDTRPRLRRPATMSGQRSAKHRRRVSRRSSILSRPWRHSRTLAQASAVSPQVSHPAPAHRGLSGTLQPRSPAGTPAQARAAVPSVPDRSLWPLVPGLPALSRPGDRFLQAIQPGRLLATVPGAGVRQTAPARTTGSRRRRPRSPSRR